MPSFIAAFALQQLKDMEALQRDFGRRRTPWWRRRKAAARPALPAVREAGALWTLPHQTRRTPGVSASSKTGQ